MWQTSLDLSSLNDYDFTNIKVKPVIRQPIAGRSMAKQKNDMQSAQASEAREVVRGCLTATLASLEPETHDPAASLVAVATDISGTPLLLISELAHHTHNITADNRAALLFDGTAKHDSPLEGGRVSLKGHLVQIDNKDKIER